MNALKLIAGLAFVCLAGTGYAQGCAGHAQVGKGGAGYDMATVSKELNLTEEQQTAFTEALTSCEKDCAAMASTGKAKDPAGLAEGKATRFNAALASLKSVLNADQYTKLQEMNTSGKLAGLCGGGDAKGCGKSSAKGGCCAGKAGASAQPAKAPKAETGSSPTIQ